MENEKNPKVKADKYAYTREHKTTPAILDYTLSSEEKVITQILLRKYCLFFTDHRVILYNSKKVKGGGIEVTSIPYGKIKSWSVKYKNVMDLHPTLQILVDGGIELLSFQFMEAADALSLHKLFVHYCK